MQLNRIFKIAMVGTIALLFPRSIHRSQLVKINNDHDNQPVNKAHTQLDQNNEQT